MRSYWYLPLCVCLTAGCLASNGLEYEAVAQHNMYRIAKTQKGMSEAQVLRIMHKPYCYESFYVGEDTYDVWFYVTRTTVLDQTRMVPQNLTPLTFKNGVLVGQGYSWYYSAMKEQAAEVAAQNPPPPKPPTQAQEDKEFEKLLRSPVPKTKAATIQSDQNTKPSPAQQNKKRKSKSSQSNPQAGTQNLQNKPTNPRRKPQNPTPVNPQTTSMMIPLNGQVAALGSKWHPWSPSPVGAVQKQQLSKARIGMTEAEVTNLIGAPTSYESYTIRNDLYDVWFYETMDRSGNTSYTPLTFKNSTLMGTTNRYYEKIKREGTLQNLDGWDRGAERMTEDESEQNFNFW